MISGSRYGQVNTIFLFVIGVLLLVGAMSALFITSLVGEIAQEFNDSGDFSNESLAVINDFEEDLPAWLDQVFLIIVGLLAVGSLVMVYFMDIPPIFIIFDVLFLIFVLVAAMMFSNFYEEISAESDFSGFEDDYPVMNFVMSNLALFIVAYFILLVGGLIIKSRRF